MYSENTITMLDTLSYFKKQLKQELFTYNTFCSYFSQWRTMFEYIDYLKYFTWYIETNESYAVHPPFWQTVRACSSDTYLLDKAAAARIGPARQAHSARATCPPHGFRSNLHGVHISQSVSGGRRFKI